LINIKKLEVNKLYAWKYQNGIGNQPAPPFIFFVVSKIYEEEFRTKYNILSKNGLGVGLFITSDTIEELA
jgi:hypothetical protein